MTVSVLTAYIFWFRIHDLGEHFGLFADQIRDWNIALRPFRDLPLSGTPSTAGGFTIGPAYYWVLWLVAHSFGTAYHFLPHSGGLGLALLHSLADGALFIALAARLRSRLIAVVIVLLVATAGPDATIAATIWNPPVAEAFAKAAMAILIWRPAHWGWTLMLAACAWAAVQAHTAGVIVAFPVLAWRCVASGMSRGWLIGTRELAIVFGVIGTMQVPWLSQGPLSSADPISIRSSLNEVAAAPAERVRFSESIRSLVRAVQFVLFTESVAMWLVGVALLVGIVGCLVVKDAAIVVSGPAVLVTSIIVFALWQGDFQVYWYQPVFAAVSITLLSWLSVIPYQGRQTIATVILIALILSQPSRAHTAWTLHSMPYGALLRGSRALVDADQSVRAIETTFPVRPGTDVTYLFSLLGGRLGDGPVGIIDANGTVTLRR